MTDEEINLKVAELCGELPMYAVEKGAGNYYRTGGHGYTSEIERAGRYTQEEGARELCRGEIMRLVPIPAKNYCNDLNACAEFEAGMSFMDLGYYANWIQEDSMLYIVGYTAGDYRRDLNGLGKLIGATARQRCLAFIGTKIQK